ncbi:antirepressor [Lentibacillus populi]|uniref:Antirepressor n=1 Tax=Lentibacillus populi TaxID=1827502 RepID=A0A9W5TX11_9BACI|nr:Rha family transcriptional regulator [Lentibacillus populi]GGB41390.1 antirepressor [Lentibacillus populi]
MNQLVFKNNNQIVTSSRNVARDFEKRHDHVTRDIDEIVKWLPKNGDTQQMFLETTYIHEQNKQEYRQYLMNRDGFTLLVMGFTGKQAMDFKLQYMNAFNKMEQELKKPRALTEKEQLVASMKLSIEATETLEQHNERITNLEETMRIDGAQEHTLNMKGKRVVMEALGGKSSPAYKNMAFKVFSAFWRDFKNHFEIPRYGDLPKKKFEDGLHFIGMWQPSTSLKIEIDESNNQQTFNEVI